MRLQNYQIEDERINEMYMKEKKNNPEKFRRKIDLSWSIWMFGRESLEKSFQRLRVNDLKYVELKGDFDGNEENLRRTKKLLEKMDLAVSGVCGIYSLNEDLASESDAIRQNALNYLMNQIDYVSDLGGTYLIVVPSAVGRLKRIDKYEFERSATTLKILGNYFADKNVKAAIEPIRSAEVCLVNKVDQAIEYIDTVNERSINGINGDIYHMINEEKHIGEAVMKCDEKLVNLHLADSNRDGLGRGVMDIDTVIKAAYLVGMNENGRFLTFEPLGPFPDPYVLSSAETNEVLLDELVKESVDYFREREEIVRKL
jgi:sugar phosphate isomerase/epimerase